MSDFSYAIWDRGIQTPLLALRSQMSNKLQFGPVIVCFVLSFISLLDTGSDGSDVADDLPPRVYCDLVTTLNSKCVMTNLLEMFRYDEEVIRTSSTQVSCHKAVMQAVTVVTSSQEIIRAVHELGRSPWYGYTRDFSSLLGGVSRYL